MIELATRVFTADSVAALNQDDMAAAYQSALMTYLQDGTEEALMAAFTLARRALAVDLPVSDLAVFHADALRALPPNPAPDQGGCDRPMNFMVEFLSVYDMALQGYKKTVPLLTTEISERRRAEQQLRAATMELAFERDSLDAKVVARTRELGEKAAHLLATLDQLRQTNREQAEFTYAISHDLKSPSNTITMLIDELRLGYEHLLDGDAVELLELAQQTANRMRRLVDDVLSYSRCIETHPEHEPVYLDALVTEIVADLRYDIERTRAVLSFPVFPVLIGNRMQLKLLLQNLISNAIKFSDPSRPPVVTLAHSITSAGRLQISVQDNGIGIEPAHFDRVFGLFQRLHSHDVYGGSGIGLALCRRIAVNHGSDIKLASEPGRGSSFTFSLERHIE